MFENLVYLKYVAIYLTKIHSCFNLTKSVLVDIRTQDGQYAFNSDLFTITTDTIICSYIDVKNHSCANEGVAPGLELN